MTDEWEYQVGDVIENARATEIRDGGVPVHSMGGERYKIKFRLICGDRDDKRYYYVERRKEGEPDEDMLKSAGALEQRRYEVVDSEEVSV